MRIFTFLLIGFVCLAAMPAAADVDHPIEPFVGRYIGHDIASNDPSFSSRDAAVAIRKKGDGFIVDWSTTTHLPTGKVKRKSYSIHFRPTNRGSIFASAMRKNKFGAPVPLDPLKGEPYVWARIVDKTLTVYALLVTDEGGYEMQVYERTVTASGLELLFTRIRDGEQYRTITAKLDRTEG